MTDFIEGELTENSDESQDTGNENSSTSLPEPQKPEEKADTKPGTKAKYILLSDIEIDKEYRVRIKENKDVIDDYRALFEKYMEDGEKRESYPFGPIHIWQREDKKFDLIAGFHRYYAAQEQEELLRIAKEEQISH